MMFVFCFCSCVIKLCLSFVFVVVLLNDVCVLFLMFSYSRSYIQPDDSYIRIAEKCDCSYTQDKICVLAVISSKHEHIRCVLSKQKHAVAVSESHGIP
jgi:hypothetical protein